jgi:hypothetical protein
LIKNEQDRSQQVRYSMAHEQEQVHPLDVRCRDISRIGFDVIEAAASR